MANKFYRGQRFLSRFRLWKSEKENSALNEENIKNRELSEEALQLLEILGKENLRVKEFLINNYKGLPVSPEMEEAAYKYSITHSAIFAATTSNPGTSVLTEFLYEGIPSPPPLDNYFLQSKAGKAVKARLIAIEEKLPKIIEEYRSKGDVLIGNLGSGPGRDVIDTFSLYYRNISNVKAIHIEKNITALKKGKRMAVIKGVDHLIDFVEGNFLKYKPVEKFDIALLIGILCSLKNEICINILKRIKKMLKKDSCLIVSNASKKMQKEDPFTCHIMEWGPNWKLVFKDEEELKQIYEKAGYTWKGYFLDSYGFHIIGMGIPHFYF